MEYNIIKTKDLYFHYAEKLGISNEDAIVLMKLALASRDEVLRQPEAKKTVYSTCQRCHKPKPSDKYLMCPGCYGDEQITNL
jgi:cytochrome c2